MAHAILKYNMRDLRAKSMSSRDQSCTSDCASNSSARLFLCNHCRQQVIICRRCDRGQLYCSPDCALEVRRRNQHDARRRYQATDRGRRMHADRSRKYRARGSRVTDQGPTFSPQPETARAAAMATQPPVMIAARRITACDLCGNPVSDMVRLSPIRRPRRRPMIDRSIRPAGRRRLFLRLIRAVYAGILAAANRGIA
jgi:hypothetical protein